MDWNAILKLIITLVGPLISLALVKRVLSKGITAVSGEVLKLSYWPKLIIGLVWSFGFIVLLGADAIPGIAHATGERWSAVILTALSKVLFDLWHDATKQ